MLAAATAAALRKTDAADLRRLDKWFLEELTEGRRGACMTLPLDQFDPSEKSHA
jgi:hypothetical protein